MAVLLQCTLCGKRPMEPRERKGGVFYECSNCDSPTGKMPPSRPEEDPNR